MRLLMILFLMFSAATTQFAQLKKFRYSIFSCDYEGTYDSAKYSEAKLRATLKLINAGEFSINADATPRRIADVPYLDVVALDREYAVKAAGLRKLPIVETAYFTSLRDRHLKELEQVYRLSKVTMQAYNAPVTLRRYIGADSCVKTYADPLVNGGDDLLAAWRHVNEKARNDNIDPARVKSVFDRQFDSPEKYDYARIEVMTFGWWNCANHFVERVGYDGGQEKQFEKLFRRVRKIQCDEP